MRPHLVLLLVFMAAPTVADAARVRASAVDRGIHKPFLLSEDARAPAGATRFTRMEVTLDLTAPDAYETRVVVDLSDPASGVVPLWMIDETLGETCRLDVGEDVEDDDASGAFRQTEVDARGRSLCGVELSEGGDRTVTLVVRRPRVDGLDDRFAFRSRVQPPHGVAEAFTYAVESFTGSEPLVRLPGWSTELRKKALDGGRIRTFLEMDGVVPHPPLRSVRSEAGRLPEVVVTSGENWDDIALDHRLQYLAAGKATGPVIRLAGRVLARGGGLPSVMEAARIALDEVALDPIGGGGGTWRLPQSAQYTLEDGRGTAADRAALLLALLRTADVRAEIVMTSSAGEQPDPDVVLPLLDRTLVFVPGVAWTEGRPLYIDPMKSSAWVGELDENLPGRRAALLAPEGVRWLQLPEARPASSWSLRGVEDVDGFAVSLTASLRGPAAARVRAWDRAGRPEGVFPAGDLAWAGGPWKDALSLEVSEGSPGRLVVQAQGRLPRARVLDAAGALMGAPVPSVVTERPAAVTEQALGLDVRPFALQLRESWRFLGRRAGGGSPSFKKATPFWDGRGSGSWTGPLFTRELELAWTGLHLAPGALGEPERLQDALGEFYRRVLPPAVP